MEWKDTLSFLLQAESLLRWCLGTSDNRSQGHICDGNTVKQKHKDIVHLNICLAVNA